MSHVQNHIQIPSLKRNLSGGAINSSSSSLNVNTSHMNMSAAASLSALASGPSSTDRGTMQPPSSIPHRHEQQHQQPQQSHQQQHALSSMQHPSMPHAYPSSQHERYHSGPPQHSMPITSTTPPTIQRAVTASSVYNRQPITTRVSTASIPTLQQSSQTSTTRSPGSTGTTTPAQDWRMYLTIEERQAVRSKIHDAYTSTCKTYEELLQAASAIEEELLHIAAPSRLDYFKSGFEFENRVKLKQEQLQGQLASIDRKKSTSERSKGSPDASSKKSRKQHG